MEMLTTEQTQSQTAPAEKSVVTVSDAKGYLVVKRLLDIVFAICAGGILLIPMLIVALMIRIDSRGPAIFKQERMGRGGKAFVIYKFRTMKQEAPRDVAACELQNPEQFVTKLGGLLRRTSIDELPQVFNILKGDMSLVGYRPVCLTEEKLNELRQQYGVFALRPGITGLAQVSGRDNVDYRTKAQLDAEYVRTCSMKTDVQCLLKTIRIVVSGEGVN